VTIVSGDRSRDKRVQITGLDGSEIRRRLLG
jgi:uncharacterized protein YggU (UPF0235/DUF167 family)